MPGLAINGEVPPLTGNERICIVDEIRRFDVVTIIQAEPDEYHIRVVKPKDYSNFTGIMYQVDTLDDGAEGSMYLRQVIMKFWPFE